MASTLIIAIVVVVVLILLGMNVGVSFLVTSLLLELITGGEISGFARTAFSANNSYSLLAIPLFMLGGNLMEKSGIAGALVDFCQAFLGKVKGGLGYMVPLVSMIFGALCGSGVATVSTIGSIVIPRMEQLGWDRRYTTALAAACAPLGYMIPPNMNAIIYSTVTTASVSALFVATVIPGIMWGVGYMIVNRIVYRKWYDPTRVGQNEAAFETQQKVREAQQ
ncbi:MAG: TRAP transporter large permease subunit, partial [Clostridiales bacterium]|nr:TRAP transporter large permease subunit [Clostridiales bacterium]